MVKHYPPEFKTDVVKLALSGEVPKRQIAEDVGISETTLFRWIRQHELDTGGRRDGLTSQEQAELRQLRRDKRRLEQENEILRRAAAYFAKDALPK